MTLEPQLRMVHSLETLPSYPLLPIGCRLREAVPSDADGLAFLLTEAFEEEWTVSRAEKVLLFNENVPKTWVVESEGGLVATASYQLQREFPASGWIHFVAASPNRRGLGLGYAVTWTVLETCVREGHERAMLTTDDHRLAAIRTYRKLGFEPDPWHGSHSARWMALDEGASSSS